MKKWIASALAVSLAAVGGIALRSRDRGPSEGIAVGAGPSRPGQVAAAGAKPPRGGVAAAQADPSVRPAPTSLSGEYQVLLRQSVFSSKPLAQKSPAGEAMALKGISQEGDQFTAFIEDATGGIREVRAGEAIGEGRIREITLHEVRLESGGRVMPIEVGQMLDGRGAAADPAPTTPALAQATPQAKQAARAAAATPTPAAAAAAAAVAKSPRPKTGDPAGGGGRAYTFGDPR
jgi:hypothetical protein